MRQASHVVRSRPISIIVTLVLPATAAGTPGYRLMGFARFDTIACMPSPHARKHNSRPAMRAEVDAALHHQKLIRRASHGPSPSCRAAASRSAFHCLKRGRPPTMPMRIFRPHCRPRQMLLPPKKACAAAVVVTVASLTISTMRWLIAAL